MVVVVKVVPVLICNVVVIVVVFGIIFIVIVIVLLQTTGSKDRFYSRVIFNGAVFISVGPPSPLYYYNVTPIVGRPLIPYFRDSRNWLNVGSLFLCISS